jgi:Phosphotransferase enzyme family
MAEDLLVRLRAIDLSVLTEVVRQDQRHPSFEITEWSIRRLSDKGFGSPDGLWLFNGFGQTDGLTRPWSVAVKIRQHSNDETPPDARNYWKRELLVAQSGLLDRLSGPARGPRFYRTDEHPDDVWLWMEHVQDERSSSWTLDDFIFAARQLGRWNGACAAKPLPTEPWLVKQPHRTSFGDPVNPELAWQSPLHQKHITEAIRLRVERLWAERNLFYGILEGLPQCFVHFDCQRRNLLIHRGADGQDELVMIDWALCGVSAVGVELHALVGGSTTFFEWPSSALATLEAAAFTSYVQGLREAGWSEDVDAVRLAHVASLAIYRGAVLPYFMNWFCSPEGREFTLQQFGLAGEDLYMQLLPVLYYWLDCADEARELMKKLRLN